MIAQWTADIVSQMHLHKITAKRLAEEAGYNEKYLSGVLNGHYDTRVAEGKLRAALGRIISEQAQDTTEQVQ